MVGWHHQLNGHEFEQTLGESEGQGCLACYSPLGCKESDTTWRLNTTWHEWASQVVLEVKNCLPTQAAEEMRVWSLGQEEPLESPMDFGAWWAAVHRIAKSRTWPKWLSTHAVWLESLILCMDPSTADCKLSSFALLHKLNSESPHSAQWLKKDWAGRLGMKFVTRQVDLTRFLDSCLSGSLLQEKRIVEVAVATLKASPFYIFIFLIFTMLCWFLPYNNTNKP